MSDPVFMGYCSSKEAECANKVVRKGFPTEAVCITCKVDDHYQVVEYSEITQKSAEKRNKDKSLVYGAANICIHFFIIEFLERVVMFNEDFLTPPTSKGLKEVAPPLLKGEVGKEKKDNSILKSKLEKIEMRVSVLK